MIYYREYMIKKGKNAETVKDRYKILTTIVEYG